MTARLNATNSPPTSTKEMSRTARGRSATSGGFGRTASSNAIPAATAVAIAILNRVERCTYGTANRTGKTISTAKPPNSDGMTSGATTSSSQNVAQTAMTAASTSPAAFRRSAQTRSATESAVASSSGHSQDAPRNSHISASTTTPADAASRSSTTN